MRILVHEFVSGGGLSGRAAPASLAREGRAMRDALVADLARLDGHRLIVTLDPRFPLRLVPPRVETVVLPRGDDGRLDALLRSADAAWLVAPETRGCLEGLAARAEGAGTRLLGPGAAAIRRAADKARLPALLARHGVPHPETRVVAGRGGLREAARELGLPVVVKPARGAGCEGVVLARSLGELDAAARGASPRDRLLVQSLVRGTPASVSLLANGRRAVALGLNGQALGPGRRFAYRGGRTPLEHPLKRRAVALARRACRALGGLRGYVGVDLVLGDAAAVVIEVNPRLTTSYLGLRAALPPNLAGLALAACQGRLPRRVAATRRVRFTAAGRVRPA